MAANKHRTSLKDLAQELGVSIATVSRALRSSPEIGQDMQAKVKELAKRLNYRPNPFAQSLRKEAPRVIGVVVPNLVTHYNNPRLRYIYRKYINQQFSHQHSQKM